MSDVKHTPGPWTAKEFASPADTFYVLDSEGHLLLGAGKTITKADALLIAAAPELLAALKSLEYTCEYNDLRLMAESVIAKAEGR